MVQDYGGTPLFTSILRGRAEAVWALLGAGAAVDQAAVSVDVGAVGDVCCARVVLVW